MTASEERPWLWRSLAARKLEGVLFLRQTVLAGRFIVGLFAPNLGLAVEVDGQYHAGRKPADVRRDRVLERAGEKLGVSCRRQVVVGEYIVDLLAPAARVVVDDGPYHVVRHRADACRTHVLERAGYRVLRFTAEEVMHELPSVLERIRAEIKSLNG